MVHIKFTLEVFYLEQSLRRGTRKQSAFTRTIQLPDGLESDPEVCHLENGVLKLAFKKIIAKEKEPAETIKKISIKKS